MSCKLTFFNSKLINCALSKYLELYINKALCKACFLASCAKHVVTTPVCQSDTDINKIVGENNCGIPPDRLLFTCIVQYEGNEPPVLNWNSVGGGNTNGVVLPPTVQSGRVMRNISLSGDSLVNRSSYECFATRRSSPRPSCRLGDMTIISKCRKCKSIFY